MVLRQGLNLLAAWTQPDSLPIREYSSRGWGALAWVPWSLLPESRLNSLVSKAEREVVRGLLQFSAAPVVISLCGQPVLTCQHLGSARRKCELWQRSPHSNPPHPCNPKGR